MSLCVGRVTFQAPSNGNASCSCVCMRFHACLTCNLCMAQSLHIRDDERRDCRDWEEALQAREHAPHPRAVVQSAPLVGRCCNRTGKEQCIAHGRDSPCAGVCPSRRWSLPRGEEYEGVSVCQSGDTCGCTCRWLAEPHWLCSLPTPSHDTIGSRRK